MTKSEDPKEKEQDEEFADEKPQWVLKPNEEGQEKPNSEVL